MPAKEVDGTAVVPARRPNGRCGVPLVTLTDQEVRSVMRIVIVASGSLDPRDARWLDGADRIVAVDGGSIWLDGLGRRPDRLIGDLDSTPPELVATLERAGTRVDRHPTDKDASDLELALAASGINPDDDVVVLGALGGSRLDHEISNLLLLADSTVTGRSIRFVHGVSTVRRVLGDTDLALTGAPGDLVSLLPIGGDAEGVTTAGLRWPLRNAVLRIGRSRGLSNEIVASPASVSLRDGVLLVVETSLQGAPSA